MIFNIHNLSLSVPRHGHLFRIPLNLSGIPLSSHTTNTTASRFGSLWEYALHQLRCSVHAGTSAAPVASTSDTFFILFIISNTAGAE